MFETNLNNSIVFQNFNRTQLSRMCLILASFENGSVKRDQLYVDLCLLYSEKRVVSKMLTLVKHGYLEYGVSIRTAWITPKGDELREELKNAQ